MDIGVPIAGIALCRCGCGRPAPLARQRDRLRNYEKGQPTMFVHGHHGRRNTVAAGAVDALDLPAALSAPTASSIPVPAGVRPDVHERFWSVVARACEKECARFPALIFKPDAADDTEAN